MFHEAFGIAGAALIGINEAARASRIPSRFKQVVIYGFLAVAALVIITKAEAVFAEERSRVAGNAGASSYRTGPIQAGPLSVPADVVVGFVLYELAPLPYQVRGPLDLLSFADSVLRVAMFAPLLKVRRSREVVAVAMIAVAVQLSFSLRNCELGHEPSSPLCFAAGHAHSGVISAAERQSAQRAERSWHRPSP